MAPHAKLIRAYGFPLILFIAILLGCFTGYFLGEKAQVLKPFGDIFLNLIFTAIVPLIFFSISSAVVRTKASGKLGRIFFYMAVVFLLTSSIAALYALIIVKFFPPAQGVNLGLALPKKLPSVNFLPQLTDIFTAPSFASLLSHEHILALIIFSLLFGLAVAGSKEKGEIFAKAIQAGEVIFIQLFNLIMYYAPIGFFAYFAVLVSEIGPKLMEGYLRIGLIYYLSSIIFFFTIYSLYAYLAAKKEGLRLFWKNSLLPITTSLATCSSAASIPANLIATKAMRVPVEIAETVVPLGSLIHKDGSVIGGMFKIAFLFGLFHLSFSDVSVLCIAFVVSLLVGTVMGAIPSGGMMGELLILSIYGFPSSTLLSIAAISIIIDPLATMLNVMGNSVSSLMIARMVEGRNWIIKIS